MQLMRPREEAIVPPCIAHFSLICPSFIMNQKMDPITHKIVTPVPPVQPGE